MIIAGNFPLDEAVVEALPAGTRVHSADRWGISSWNLTARINAVDSCGKEKRYFLKCATSGDVGGPLMEGEFRAMMELYKLTPSLIPKPHSWGKFKSAPPVGHYIIYDFKDMSPKLPDPKSFCSELANLHRTSESPTGKFGFYMNTTHGKFPQRMEWNSSWESLFRKLLSDLMLLDLKTNGPWEDFQNIYERALTLVLPKLIGPLESEGRTLKPCLLHGDLWEGNIGIDQETGHTYIFDASSFYGHNELELGMWRGDQNQMSFEVYGEEYLRNFGISEPADQFDDRNRIYHVKFLMWHSAHHPHDLARQGVYENMCYLVDKYAPWPNHEPSKNSGES